MPKIPSRLVAGMHGTRPKAERPEDRPAFLKKYNDIEKKEDGIPELKRKLRAQGYIHFISPDLARVTVGTLDNEWRILDATLCFKDPMPTLQQLKSGEVSADVAIIETRKNYSNGQSYGKGYHHATLSPAEFKEWCAFFEPWFDEESQPRLVSNCDSRA